jgi:Amt family ammonium transporter
MSIIGPMRAAAPMTGTSSRDVAPEAPAGAVARASFEHALDAMLLADDGRRYIDANSAACSLLGLPYEEVVSRRLDDFVPEEARPPLDAVWRDFLESGNQSGEFELVVADGSRRTVEFRATARVLPGCHLSVLRDITGRAAAEEGLRTKEAYDFLSGVLQHVDAGLHVVDDRRRMSFVNPAAAAILGYGSPNELVGLPVHETIHYKRPDGSSFPAEECPHLGVFDTGQSIRGEDWFVRKDGSMVPVSYSSAAIPLPGGRGAVVAFHDITERRRADLDREREREFLDAVLESLDAGVVACGPDGALSLFNRATREMHGVSNEPLPPEDWAGRYDLFRPDGRTPMGVEDVPLFRALQGERVRDAELVIAPRNRPPRIVLCNGRAIESKDGRPLGAVVAMHDVTERRRAEEQLAHQAMHDSLTGLPNRALLLDRLGHVLAALDRDGGAVATLLVNLDHFKLVNDSLGHRVGDELLVAVATRLEEALRGADTVGRPGDSVAHLGGDEFVVLCEGLTRERDAVGIAERLADALRVPFAVGGERVFASASIGIALSSGEGTPESQLRDAAVAMDRAKERGRARCELFDEAMRARVVDRLQRENELRRAIDQNELRLYYQPIVSLADRRIVGVEALVRWDHPQRGILAPAEFIELAEESGLILPLGAWVLEEACRQIARWEQSWSDRLPLRVSINVSARQLAQQQFAKAVEQAVHEAGADPTRLALEITETVLMEDGEAPVDTLQALKRLGITLVLDDFGTGYSSLSYLQRLPFDTLKLDRSFVAPLAHSGGERNIATAVVEMAHALDMKIVAEGVEDEEQLQVLDDLGCDLAQGYLFARPMPAVEMTDLLAAAAAGGTLRGSTAPVPELLP